MSVHLIKTEYGLVMIDTGFPDMYEQILDSMNELGFNPKDICAIFHSHGHIDHFGCTQKFKELSGAKTYISRIDNDIVNGTLDLSWAKELGYNRLPPFDSDVLVEDDEEFSGRVIAFLNTVKDGGYENVAAFCHGGVLRKCAEYVLRAKNTRGTIICRNCVIAILEYNGEKWHLHSWINTQ